MYKKDDRGEYRCAATWVDAWNGEHGFPGWCVCEVREYSDGTVRVHRGEPNYLKDHPEKSAIHAVYLIAAHALGAKT